MLNPKQRDVARKILYAVETGGQVYGKQRYNDFTEAYTNSPAEHAITIGAGAWYATEAKRLLELFREIYPDKFKQLDTAGIGTDLDKSNWSKYCAKKDSAKAKCIVDIISSPEGIKCQDSLMQIQILQYESYIEATYGDMNAAALIECINIRHQGGTGALKRILAKTKKPYSVDNIYAALCTDPDDKSSNNQVGDYTTRQKKVYDMIKQHINEGGTPMSKTAEAYLDVWRGWIGYNESNGKHKIIIDLYNGHKPLARSYKVKYSDEWCDTTVSAAAIKAQIVDLIGTECSCQRHIDIFKAKGIWIEDGTITPKPGYIIVYNWDDVIQPNDGWADHIGVVEKVSNGQITAIEGNYGQAVARRVLSVGNGYIRGYAAPKYDTIAVSKPSAPSTDGTINREVAWTGVVNTGALNVRTWPGTNNRQIISYPTITQGTKVGVCDTLHDDDGDPWYFVKISGDKGDKYGFIAAAYITKQTTSAPDNVKDDGIISNEPAWKVKVTADALNVRTWAGTNNSKLKSYPTINKGKIVDVCDVVNAKDGSKWYYIKIDDKVYGFVHSAYVKKI